MNPARITIVVLNWNLREETLACLASLRRAELRGAAVMVVDNGSRDGSVEAIRAAYPDVQVVALPENRGYAGGNNAGIRAALEAGAEGVLLLNNDTEVAPDFLGSLLDAVDSLPSVAAVSSAILRRDRPEMLDVAYSEVRFDRRHVVRIVGVNAMMGHGFDRRCEVDVAIGCSLLLSADALRNVGLFDEEFFAYHEEVDWCLRARKWGYHILFEPFSRVYHQGSRSTTRLRPAPPPAPRRPGDVELPNAEAPPWNPVRAYLGARNIVRLLRTHATPDDKREFLRACARELPREFLAVVWGREGWMTLGRWEWADVGRFCFVERHPWLARLPRPLRALALVLLVPFDVLIGVPWDVWRAARAGRLEQFLGYLRGLRDGYLRRPIPLRRLGLR
ncbi:MAG TPA: glycosyltransferase family 2 protein [Candidatus Binatia bacterium]|nr:glycosyltransferase family 2 protein [Candidatus Binatia bacterium]